MGNQAAYNKQIAHFATAAVKSSWLLPTSVHRCVYLFIRIVVIILRVIIYVLLKRVVC